MNNEIGNYCQNHLINRELIKKILAVSEELGVQTVLPLLSKQDKASLTLEFSDDGKKVNFTIKYDGDKKDPTGSNDLAYMIAQHLSEPIGYIYDELLQENILTATILIK